MARFFKKIPNFKLPKYKMRDIDDIEELKTICQCGSKATQNLRLVNNQPVFEGEQIVIDDHTKVEYTGVCGKCYLRIRRKI